MRNNGDDFRTQPADAVDDAAGQRKHEQQEQQAEGNLNDAYALPFKDELFLHNAHIGAYKPAMAFGHLPVRTRKLLLHRKEIDKWSAKVRERGYTIVPLMLYFKGAHVKVRLGLALGKTNIDRRSTIKERETKREIERALRRR